MSTLSVKTLQRLALKGIISAENYFQLKRLKKRKNCRPEYIRLHFAFDSFTNDECLLWFRFSREEIETLVVSLKIPSVCIANPRIKFSGIEGLCILLRRLSYPNRLNELVTTFNRDATVLSRIFNWMINWMYNRYSAYVKTLRQKYLTPEKLAYMAEVTSLCACAYPNVIGFIDGTFRPSCKRFICSLFKRCIMSQRFLLTANAAYVVVTSSPKFLIVMYQPFQSI